MPYPTPSCQLTHAQPGDSRGNSPLPAAAQTIQTTPSRRTGPRKWIRAVEWLVAAGYHSKTNSTTLAIARDLAARMDYDTGHARYCLDEIAARLNVDRSTVKRHVSYLRELGALAWVQHGTKANIRQTLGLGGYAATATMYAATIPASYDVAMGRTLIGTGYNARIITDMRGPQSAPAETPEPVDNSPVNNPVNGSCAPPSLVVVVLDGQVDVAGGFNYTPRKRASRPTEATPTPKTSSNSQTPHTRRSALQVAKDIRIARQVRPLVNWTQSENLRRLAYSLRPFIDRGLDSDQIADELAGMCPNWRPRQPANYIRVTLANQAQQDTELAAADERRTAATWHAASAQQAADLASLHALFGTQEEPEARTDDDRRAARLNWNLWPDVIAHYEEDPDDAIDLYGVRFVQHAISKDATNRNRMEASYA